MKVSVFGAGYVGLVTAVCLAKIGHTVICIDNDQNKIHLLAEGISPIYEAGLEPLLNKFLSTKNIQFTGDPLKAIENSDLMIIAVGTPLDERGNANLSYVYQVTQTIAEHLNHSCVIVLKSTSPPGTSETLTRYLHHQLKKKNLNIHCDVASNPEFLQEGTAIQQFMHPDRIIVGADNIHTIQTLYDLYQPLIKNKEQFLIMNKTSAELTKYASNAFLATKVSFMNEISQIAEQVGADIESVRTGMSLDYRINPLFLNAGCGFGGSCFPKDISALLASAQHTDVKPFILESVIKRNLTQQQLLFHKVNRFFEQQLQGKTIALWGLTFKPNTDDVRSATSHILSELFWKAGCFIKAYDPLGMENFSKHYPNHPQLELCSSPLDALENADVLVIVTEWNEFKQVPLAEIKNRLRYNAIFDGRNILQPSDATRHQLIYYGIGRSNCEANPRGV
ncbi:MAG: hypothetical protein A3F10_01960 [Coxiella sp. RIFCSPHIGHO2_12_FULL_42_15]|nr:MAG: hypothetical protein A3F10_01960 [Coxiella sp. RIFCSPHIGHO2_12_FULL_42_15]